MRLDIDHDVSSRQGSSAPHTLPVLSPQSMNDNNNRNRIGNHDSPQDAIQKSKIDTDNNNNDNGIKTKSSQSLPSKLKQIKLQLQRILRKIIPIHLIIQVLVVHIDEDIMEIHIYIHGTANIGSGSVSVVPIGSKYCK